MPQTSTNPQSIVDELMDYLGIVFNDIKITNRPPLAPLTQPFYGNDVNKVYQGFPDLDFDRDQAPVIWYALIKEEPEDQVGGVVRHEIEIAVNLGIYAPVNPDHPEGFDPTDPVSLAEMHSLLRDFKYDLWRAVYADPTFGDRVDHAETRLSLFEYDEGIAAPRAMCFATMKVSMYTDGRDIARLTH